MLLGKFLRRHLRMSRSVRMDDKGLDIGDIREQGEDLQAVDELPCIFLSSIDLKCEDGAGTLREILEIEGMVRMRFQGRMAD